MNHTQLTLALGLLLFISCTSKIDNGKTFNSTYEVGNVPGIDSLKVFTELENEIINSLRNDSPNYFKNNRSRIIMRYYRNNVMVNGELSRYKSIPMPCDCATSKDTLYVNMTMGLFGGLGYNIKISRKHFESEFFEYTEDIKPFRANLNDTSSASFTNVKSKYQYLILNETPTFHEGQQLTGFLSMTSNTYYLLKDNTGFDSMFVLSKLHFTCITNKYDIESPYQ